MSYSDPRAEATKDRARIELRARIYQAVRRSFGPLVAIAITALSFAYLVVLLVQLALVAGVFILVVPVMLMFGLMLHLLNKAGVWVRRGG